MDPLNEASLEHLVSEVGCFVKDFKILESCLIIGRSAFLVSAFFSGFGGFLCSPDET